MLGSCRGVEEEGGSVTTTEEMEGRDMSPAVLVRERFLLGGAREAWLEREGEKREEGADWDSRERDSGAMSWGASRF